MRDGIESESIPIMRQKRLVAREYQRDLGRILKHKYIPHAPYATFSENRVYFNAAARRMIAADHIAWNVIDGQIYVSPALKEDRNAYKLTGGDAWIPLGLKSLGLKRGRYSVSRVYNAGELVFKLIPFRKH